MKLCRFILRQFSLSVAGFFAGMAFTAQSATFVWDGGGNNNNFTTASNWVGNIASPFNYTPTVTADALIFSGTTRLAPNNDTASGETNGQTAFTLSFAADAGAFVLGGNKITLGSTTGNGGSGGSISNLSAQTQTINCEVAPRSGTIRAQGGNLVFNGRFNIGNGTITRTNTFNGAFDITLNGQATSAGVVVKRGSGTLRLLNAFNDFNGPMTIAEGVVSLGTAGSIPTSPSIYVAAGARLDVSGVVGGFILFPNQMLAGDGIVTGAVDVAFGATLSPGPTATIGGLTVNGSLVLEGNTMMRWRKTGGVVTNDFVRGISSLTCVGGLVLTNIGTTALSAGDTLKLFAATSCSGIFGNITPSSPGPGLVWDLSGLSSGGTLKVSDAPGLSKIAIQPDGSATLTLTGPTNQLYDILTTTNLALPLSQWQTLTGGLLLTSPVLLKDFAISNVARRFYRSRSPTYTMLAGSLWVSNASSPGGTWRTNSTRTLDCLPTLLQAGVDSGFSTYGGLLVRQTNATGYFYPLKVGDRWWLVDPTGCLFLHRGVAAISTLSTAGAVAAFNAKFGTKTKWAADTTSLLRTNGFNGAGAWSDTTYLSAVPTPRLVYTKILNFMATYSSTNTGPGYPYVFDTAFATFSDNYAQQLAGTKTDPWLLGHFSDNELAFPTTMLTNFLSLPSGNASGDAAWAWLRTRYGPGAALGNVTSQDKLDFLGYTWGRYYEVVSQAIKRYDPNHLYLGSRLFSSDKDRPEIFRAIGPYVDVISVNHYSQWTPDINRIRMWERESGRPVIISEWYVKGADSGMANNTGAGWVVHTQTERGLFYENFTLALLESKVCVGWHWFKYTDNDPTDAGADPSNIDSNKGIVSNRYDPYDDLLNAAKRINERVFRLADYFDGLTVP
jgi:autotransporter-associated beta strand protein